MYPRALNARVVYYNDRINTKSGPMLKILEQLMIVQACYASSDRYFRTREQRAVSLGYCS